MRTLALVLLVTCLSYGNPWAATYLVLANGTGDFPTIQAAVDAAEDGDTVRLGDGTFRGEGNRDLDFAGKALTVESASGIAEHCILDCQGSLEDRHRGFNLHSGESTGTMIRGLTIKGGYAPITWGDSGSGGGMYLDEGASPTVEACRFVENEADYGGAVYASVGVALRVLGCQFEENYVTRRGGGIHLDADDASCEVTGCTFVSNQALIGGGVCVTYGVLQVTDCGFISNLGSASGGAIYIMSRTSGAILNCLFIANESDEGGAIQSRSRSDMLVQDCTFQSNGNGLIGGGLFAVLPDGGHLTVESCSFLENHAGLGGAVFIGAHSLGTSECTISNCLMQANEGQDYGGGICLDSDADPLITGCTLVFNHAGTGGSGLRGYGGAEPTLENTIIAFGTGAGAWDWGFCDDPSRAPTLSCVDIYGNEGGDWMGVIEDQLGIDGNISMDPQFCDAASEDFTLHENSPCAPFTEPNPECDLIGAFPVGCEPTPTQVGSWGAIKGMFRQPPVRR